MTTMKSILALLAAASAASAAATSVNDKITAAMNAATQVQRINALDDSDFVFNFLGAGGTEVEGTAGHTVAATSANFPGIIGNGVAMTVGFLGPCGLNTPHTHPRATEINYIVNGSVTTGMLAENGARFVANTVEAGSAIVFPKGAIHFEMNNGCDPIMFVAAFNGEDPGVLQLAQRFFGLRPDIVSATLGNIGIEQVAGLEGLIPDNVALGIDQCLQTCGITRVAQKTTQLQAKVAGNTIPGITPSQDFSFASGSSSSSSSVAAPVASSSSTPLTSQPQDLLSSSSSSSGSDSILSRTGQIILLVLASLMAAGYVGFFASFLIARKNGRRGFNPLLGREVERSTLYPPSHAREFALSPSPSPYKAEFEKYDPPSHIDNGRLSVSQ